MDEGRSKKRWSQARRKRIELPHILALSIALSDETPGVSDDAYESLRSIRPKDAERILVELATAKVSAELAEGLAILLAQQSFAA